MTTPFVKGLREVGNGTPRGEPSVENQSEALPLSRLVCRLSFFLIEGQFEHPAAEVLVDF